MRGESVANKEPLKIDVFAHISIDYSDSQPPTSDKWLYVAPGRIHQTIHISAQPLRQCFPHR